MNLAYFSLDNSGEVFDSINVGCNEYCEEISLGVGVIQIDNCIKSLLSTAK
jgi:hypothetical protein